jgi:hypothetical protein
MIYSVGTIVVLKDEFGDFGIVENWDNGLYTVIVISAARKRPSFKMLYQHDHIKGIIGMDSMNTIPYDCREVLTNIITSIEPTVKLVSSV